MKNSIFILFLVNLCNTENILFLDPVATLSHNGWNRHIINKLAENGHNVTVFSVDSKKSQTKNVHYITAENEYKVIAGTDPPFDIVEMTKMNSFQLIDVLWEWNDIAMHLEVNSNGFKCLKNYPDNFKFDLVIIDYSSGPYLLGFLYKFNYPPTIAVSAFGYPHYFISTLGGHRQPAYVAHYALPVPSKNMNFIERLFNQIIYAYEIFKFNYFVIPKQNEILKQAFENESLNINELSKHVHLALVNTNPAIDVASTLPSNIIAVGGLQIREPKTLEQDVNEFLASGKRGAILFSLGTNMKSLLFNSKTKELIIDVFRSLPDIHFLWKYESKLNFLLPKNIKVLPWIKQNDVLANPNLKGFISHCGLLSLQETIWRNVPVICLPFFLDQKRNAVEVGIAEIGINLDFATLTYESLRYALINILYDKKFINNMKKKSELFRDQPEKPLDRAMFWIEWTMRHTDDLKVIESPVRNLGGFIGNGYDIVSFMFLVVAGFMLLFWTICLVIRRKCLSRVNEKKKKE